MNCVAIHSNFNDSRGVEGPNLLGSAVGVFGP